MALPGPFGVESMSFVGPTTHGRLEGRRDPPSGWPTATGLPAFIETDMAAAALGEQLLWRSAREFRTIYYLYFGVGLGGAMVHDGSVLRGAWGNAGEIGHIPAVPDGEPCPCGNRGCLERYVSLDALQPRHRLGEARVGAREVAPVFRAAIALRSRTCSTRRPSCSAGWHRPTLTRAAGRARGSSCPTRSSARARPSRAAGAVASGGQHSVLRGAAALAVSGVLSPRFRQMFADGRGAAAPCRTKGTRHERAACSSSTTSRKSYGAIEALKGHQLLDRQAARWWRCWATTARASRRWSRSSPAASSRPPAAWSSRAASPAP